MLDKTITIEAKTTTQAANGSLVNSYAAKHTNIPASLAQKQAANVGDFKSQTPNYINRFYIDYIAGIVESDRILYNGQYYYIETVYDVAGKNQILQIDARRTA